MALVWIGWEKIRDQRPNRFVKMNSKKKKGDFQGLRFSAYCVITYLTCITLFEFKHNRKNILALNQKVNSLKIIKYNNG